MLEWSLTLLIRQQEALMKCHQCVSVIYTSTLFPPSTDLRTAVSLVFIGFDFSVSFCSSVCPSSGNDFNSSLPHTISKKIKTVLTRIFDTKVQFVNIAWTNKEWRILFLHLLMLTDGHCKSNVFSVNVLWNNMNAQQRLLNAVNILGYSVSSC